MSSSQKSARLAPVHLKIQLNFDQTHVAVEGETVRRFALPSVITADQPFRATKEMMIYFFVSSGVLAEQVLKLDFSSTQDLSHGEINHLISCALATGASDVAFESKPANLDFTEPNIMVSDLDYERIHRVIENVHSHDFSFLSNELSRAKIIPHREVPPTLVTMNSRVEFLDTETQTRRTLTLVYPQDSNPSEGKISILAPVGTALLGLQTGETIEWTLPRRQKKRVQVLAIPYQPEAFGDWHL